MEDYFVVLKDEDKDTYKEIVAKGEIKNEIEGLGILFSLAQKNSGRLLKLFRIESNNSSTLVMELESEELNIRKDLTCRSCTTKPQKGVL